ncbi:hypothetical protein [Streptomyces sp. NPDC001816]|uniref:hypothetical protein n=1 Tax=Streptomyces sp. NPDC001816 TaxID=3364612 RepID=UPI0036C97100
MAAAAVATATVSPGCGNAPTLTSGTYTAPSGGKNRSLILRLPDGYDRNRAYRLVVDARLRTRRSRHRAA